MPDIRATFSWGIKENTPRKYIKHSAKKERFSTGPVSSSVLPSLVPFVPWLLFHHGDYVHRAFLLSGGLQGLHSVFQVRGAPLVATSVADKLQE